ncbi:hypothetical protein HDA40_001736 [Hamadaea flava]|uniref:Uncharacterized protein n=1 Tax=Hamadaea flava TaxID=1742688 RepID=A0ABV8LMJ8_9ACTN|nr:hypothetical protein [Hamadaea flava]MCP2323229.1 hypothetical protein [Hamadaea flava]
MVRTPAGLLGGLPTAGPTGADPAADQVTGDAVVAAVAIRPADSLPPGTTDPAARATVDDLGELIDRTLLTYLDGEPDIGPLVEAITTRLSPDPGALADLFQLVWDKSTILWTRASDDLMRGRDWAESGALQLGFGPLGLLAPAVYDLAKPVMATFAASLPPLSEYPDVLQAAYRDMTEFAAGMEEGLSGSGLCELSFYTEIFDNLTASVQQHLVVANPVIQAGMVAGLVERLVGDLLGVVALVLLLSSGPILVALICFVVYSMWQAGQEKLAHEAGGMLATAAAQPFVTLHSAAVGVDLLFQLGRILGPIIFDILLFAIGEEPIELAVKGARQATRVADIFERLKPFLPATKEAELLIDRVAQEGMELLQWFKPTLLHYDTALDDVFLRVLTLDGSDTILRDIREYVEANAEGEAVHELVRRLITAVDQMTEQRLEGLLFLSEHRPHTNASPKYPGPMFGEINWTDVLEFAPETMEGTPDELFDLLGAIAPRVLRNDSGITKVIFDFVMGGHIYTGAAGALLAAKKLITDNPAALLRFEVDDTNRVIDIITYLIETVQQDDQVVERLVLDLIAEVKSLPSGVLDGRQRSKLIKQMRKDLLRHATMGDADLDRLVWLLDPRGYPALRAKLWVMFREALDAERGNIAKLVDLNRFRQGLEDKIARGILVQPYL